MIILEWLSLGIATAFLGFCFLVAVVEGFSDE